MIVVNRSDKRTGSIHIHMVHQQLSGVHSFIHSVFVAASQTLFSTPVQIRSQTQTQTQTHAPIQNPVYTLVIHMIIHNNRQVIVTQNHNSIANSRNGGYEGVSSIAIDMLS